MLLVFNIRKFIFLRRFFHLTWTDIITYPNIHSLKQSMQRTDHKLFENTVREVLYSVRYHIRYQLHDHRHLDTAKKEDQY